MSFEVRVLTRNREDPWMGLNYGRESLAPENRLDLISMRLMDSPKDEERVRRALVEVLLEQLCYDFVGTGEVDNRDLGEVDQRKRDLPRPDELHLDRRANRSAGLPSDEAGVERGHALAHIAQHFSENFVYVDRNRVAR